MNVYYVLDIMLNTLHSFSHQSDKASTLIISTLQTKELVFEEIQQLAVGHTPGQPDSRAPSSYLCSVSFS